MRVPDVSDLMAMYAVAREAIPPRKGESWGDYRFRMRVLGAKVHLVKEDDGPWRVHHVETAL